MDLNHTRQARKILYAFIRIYIGFCAEHNVLPTNHTKKNISNMLLTQNISLKTYSSSKWLLDRNSKLCHACFKPFKSFHSTLISTVYFIMF